MVIFTKYEFNNKLLGYVTLLSLQSLEVCNSIIYSCRSHFERVEVWSF